MDKEDTGHRKNHVVPATYYRNFRDEKNNIFACKVKEKYVASVRTTSENGIAYLEDYYKLDPVPWDNLGNKDNSKFVEKGINQSFETEMPYLWQLLVSGNRMISIRDKYRIVEVILHLKYRNPYIRNTLYTPEILSNIFEMEAASLKESDDPELLSRKETFGENFDAYIILEMWKSQLAEKGPGLLHNRSLVWREEVDTDNRIAAISKMVLSDWCILETESDPFITNDNPGVSIINEIVYNFTAIGDFEFFFPLTSKKLLCIQRRKDLINSTPLSYLNNKIISAKDVKLLNNQVALYANMEIYGSDRSVVKYHLDVYHNWRKNSIT